MCIIVYKPKNQKMPTLTTLKNCFKNNPDGAGYMLAHDGQVVIHKGLMTFEDFTNDLHAYVHEHKIDLEKTPLVMHFRITTQGGVQKGLTHPFPIVDNYDDMKKLDTTAQIALAHNGIIYPCTDARVKDHNDTMQFCKDYMTNIVANDNYWSSSDKKVKIVQKIIGSSKLAIMHANGFVKLIGQFTYDNGIFYSNSSYSYSYSNRYVFKI